MTTAALEREIGEAMKIIIQTTAQPKPGAYWTQVARKTSLVRELTKRSDRTLPKNIEEHYRKIHSLEFNAEV